MLINLVEKESPQHVLLNILHKCEHSMKQIHAKKLIARHSMITFLFKDCAWMQKFYNYIESFK